MHGLFVRGLFAKNFFEVINSGTKKTLKGSMNWSVKGKLLY